MADKRFNKTQIIIFLALVVFATSLWIGRNFVGGIFSDSYAAGKTSKKKKITSPYRLDTDTTSPLKRTDPSFNGETQGMVGLTG